MRVHGVRFVESTLAPVTRGSANGGDTSSAGVSSIAYGTVIFGKGFYGVNKLRSLFEKIMVKLREIGGNLSETIPREGLNTLVTTMDAAP